MTCATVKACHVVDRGKLVNNQDQRWQINLVPPPRSLNRPLHRFVMLLVLI